MPEPRFKTEADSEYIIIDGFKVAPAEAAVLKEAISFAGGMKAFDELPEKISFHQFEIHFSEDGSLTVKRADNSPEEIKFHFDSVDELILTVTNAIGISIDRKRLDPSPRHAGAMSMFNSGDIIEGRS